ncbi:DUF421 domain-containing protein [Luteimonas kalidii]|uniref:DUF421 domain-containing protein n=1 Tax=Luteimonas kalidii TaxID=3042025 RepID=A0ABT6JRX4_9GAMM|nr:YetF domain-containing protein [Luteimonas kalidii]MDH5833438.1 DUF421 domain-containing protein [Luteimonas kalidii]
MFFDSWHGLLRVIVVGTLAYLGLVAWLRATGKRTVSKWNAFDLIVTIALGSTLATILLTEEVALVEGVLGMGLLIMLQYAISWTSVRSGWVRRAVKNAPTLLLREGRPCVDALRKQRVTEGELRAAVRAAGHATFEEIDAVVLETDGNFSVITRGWEGARCAMSDVEGVEDRAGVPGVR